MILRSSGGRRVNLWRVVGAAMVGREQLSDESVVGNVGISGGENMVGERDGYE